MHLNDNCDGTFTIKGIYRAKQGGIGPGGKILVKAPPVVVSREPVAKGEQGEPPKAELPSYLVYRRRYSRHEEGEYGQVQESTPDAEQARSSTGNSIRDSLRPRARPSRADEMEVDGDEVSGTADVLMSDRTLRPVRRQETRAQGGSSRQVPSSALISQGTFNSPSDLLEMEDWEMAPGRIREASATEPESKSPPLSPSPNQF